MSLQKKENRRKKITSAIIAAVLIISAVMAAAFLIKDYTPAVDISVKDLKITGISAEKTDISVIFAVNNTYPLDCDITDLYFDLIMDGEDAEYTIADGRKKHMHIEKNSVTELEIPVEFDNRYLIPLAKEALLKDSLNLTIKGSADFQVLFFKNNIPFEEKRTVDTKTKDLLSLIF